VVELGDLVEVEREKNVAGDAGEEARIVAHTRRVVVPQILESPVVDQLAGREEGLGVQVARDHRDAAEPNSGPLCLIRERLLEILVRRRVVPAEAGAATESLRRH
jgi:hypothetical protein